MRAIYWRELREFAVLGTSLVVSALSVGYVLWREHTPWLVVLMFAGVYGAVSGLFHGLHDRRRRNDPFLLHRPVPRWEIECGRSLAGATVTLAAVLAMIGVLMLPWRARPWHGYGPMTFELAALCLCSALALWAAARLGAARPRPLVAMTAAPLCVAATASLIVMLPGPGPGSAVALCVAALLGALIVLERSGLTTRRAGRRAWAVAATLVACFVALDAGAWTRALGVEAVLATADCPGLNAAGVPLLLPRSGGKGARMVFPSALARASSRLRSLAREDSLPVLFGAAGESAPDTPDAIARALGERWGHLSPWRHERGRFVLEEPAGATDGEVRTVGTVGPDGWVNGPAAKGAPAFVEPRLVQLSYLWNNRPGAGSEPSGPAAVVADAGTREVIFIPLPEAGFWTAPGPLRVAGAATDPLVGSRRIALDVRGPGGVRAPRFLDTSWSAAPGTLLVRSGSDLLAFSGSGELLGRLPLDHEAELVVAVQGGQRVWEGRPLAPTGDPLSTLVVSVVGPYDAAALHLRLRHFDAGVAPIQRDVTVTPRTLTQHTATLVGGVSALFAPPLQTVVSRSSDPALDVSRSLDAVLLNPGVMGSRGGLFVWLSVLVGLLCGAGAWRRARHRTSAAGASVATATALLLGPAGLIGACVAIPPTAVEPCACGRRRAVAIAACPSCGAAWPGPEPTGTEIIVNPVDAPAVQPVHA